MRPVAVLIFHATAPSAAGPLVRALAEARRALAERQRNAFMAAGADSAEIVSGPPDGLSFGERLAAALTRRDQVADRPRTGGLVVLGSGSIPLARAADLRRFVDFAAGPGGQALANNRYSADVVAISRAEDLAGLPPLPSDNALPRWLEERAGAVVTDLRSHWRLGVDVDTPLDLIVLNDPAAGGLQATTPLVDERLAALAGVMADRRAELLVAGRISATTLRWLEHGVACRVRALVEERGLRASTRLAISEATARSAPGAEPHRPPRSVLGELLDRDGPESLAATVARLADAAVVDTRVLLAHRAGADERAWPMADDRFASDLLLPETIADPWLRALTASASTAPGSHPIVLGGHTLVNGGLRLLAQRTRAVAS